MDKYVLESDAIESRDGFAQGIVRWAGVVTKTRAACEVPQDVDTGLWRIGAVIEAKVKRQRNFRRMRRIGHHDFAGVACANPVGECNHFLGPTDTVDSIGPRAPVQRAEDLRLHAQGGAELNP